MKTFIALYGVAGSLNKSGIGDGVKEILEVSGGSYKKNIIDQNEGCDVFIHSWSKPYEQEITKVFNPTRHLIEEQEIFDIPEYVGGDYQRKQNHYSRWRSSAKVLELKRKYELENNFQYDMGILLRMDLLFQIPLRFEEFDPQKTILQHWCRVFSNGQPVSNKEFYLWQEHLPNLSVRHVGYPYNNPEDEDALLDFYAISSSKNLDILSDLFYTINEYTKEGQAKRNENGSICNHRLLTFHLKQTGLIDNLGFWGHLHCNNEITLARRSYFKSGK